MQKRLDELATYKLKASALQLMLNEKHLQEQVMKFTAMKKSHDALCASLGIDDSASVNTEEGENFGLVVDKTGKAIEFADPSSNGHAAIEAQPSP